MRVWQSGSGRLTWTPRHRSLPGENIPPRDYASCWNCGGEFQIESYNAENGLSYSPCPMCEEEGEVLTSLDAIEFDIEWNDEGSPNPTLILPNEANIYFVVTDE